MPSWSFLSRSCKRDTYALCIEANDRAAALRAASLAEPLGAHSFSYFGIWVNERLTH